MLTECDDRQDLWLDSIASLQNDKAKKISTKKPLEDENVLQVREAVFYITSEKINVKELTGEFK